MIQLIEDYFWVKVEEKRSLLEDHLRTVLAKVAEELSRVGQVGTPAGVNAIRKAYEQEMERWSRMLVGLLIETASLLRGPRAEGLAIELNKLFASAFLPFVDELKSNFVRQNMLGMSDSFDVARMSTMAEVKLSEFSVLLEFRERDSLDLVDYIRDLELSLRQLIKSKYREKYGSLWGKEIIEAIRAMDGEDAFDTMTRRKAYRLEDFLHFTQLRNLRDVIVKNWQELFASCFSIKKREFNRCMDEVLKSRTDQAHNRPAYLFTAIDRKRAEVAAYDALSSIKEGERLLMESRRQYLPYIRATRFLLGREGLKLLNLLGAMFQDLDVAIENSLHSEAFADVVHNAGFTLTIIHGVDEMGDIERTRFMSVYRNSEQEESDAEGITSAVCITDDHRFMVTPPAVKELEDIFCQFHEFATQGDNPVIWNGKGITEVAP